MFSSATIEVGKTAYVNAKIQKIFIEKIFIENFDLVSKKNGVSVIIFFYFFFILAREGDRHHNFFFENFFGV